MNNFNAVLHGNRLSSQTVFLSIVVLTMLVIFFQSNELVAAGRISNSVDYNKNSKSKGDIKSLLDQNIIKAPALVTESVQSVPGNITSGNGNYFGDPNNPNQIITNSFGHSFSILNARVALIQDSDYDGYYHLFKVTFDANVDVGSAIVFARMYIRYEGGPWNYYSTTKTFEIVGYNSYDERTVETIFYRDYPPGSYDIRIDLYEVGVNTGPVVLYGPYEDYDLSNLLLESKNYEFYDPYYDPYYDSSPAAGCSLSPNAKFDPVFPLFFLLSLIYLVRRYKSKTIKLNH